MKDEIRSLIEAIIESDASTDEAITTTRQCLNELSTSGLSNTQLEDAASIISDISSEFEGYLVGIPSYDEMQD